MSIDSISHREAVSDSAALLELSKILNASQDLDFILGNVMLSSMGKLVLTKSCVFLRNDAGNLYLRTCKGIRHESPKPEFPVPELNDAFIDLLKGDDQLAATSPEFAAFCESHNLTSIVPMVLDGAIVGLLCFGARYNKTPFTERETML